MDVKTGNRMTKVEQSDYSDRKRKRAVRNQERLISHQKKLLDNFVRVVNSGYSHENWVEVSQLYRQISSFLDLSEYSTLGRLWSESFMAAPKSSQLDRSVGLIKMRLDKSTE